MIPNSSINCSTHTLSRINTITFNNLTRLVLLPFLLCLLGGEKKN